MGCKERVSINVSLVVAAVDDFSNKPLSGSQLRVWIEGERPAVPKDGGYYLFTNLRQQKAVLNLSGAMFHEQQIVLEQNKLEQYQGKALKVRMIPNRVYPIPHNTTCVQGKALPGTVIMAYNKKKENPFRLLYAYTAGKEEISIFHPEDMDLEGKAFCIQNKEKTKWEVFRAAEQVDVKKAAYRLEKPLKFAYRKIGTAIYPIYILRADEKGEFYLPISDVNAKKPVFIFWVDGEEDGQTEIELQSGRVNYLDVQQGKVGIRSV